MNQSAQFLRRLAAMGVSRKTRRFYENDFSLLNPTIWAQEALYQLQPNMILGNLVSRDFDNKVQQFGDVVNAFIPSTFTMTRKGAVCENVTYQDASGSSAQVPLDQWPQVAFMICDGEDRPFLDLINTLLIPAVQAFGQGIDRIIGSHVYQFMENSAGHLGMLDETNIKDYILETREAMDYNNVPDNGNRLMVLTPSSETEALKLDLFTRADTTGEGGVGLRRGIIGQKYGFDFAKTQTQPEVRGGQTAFTTTTTAAASQGDTVVAATSVTNIAPGNWIVIAGDDTPQQVVSIATLNVTISPGLKRDVASGAVIKVIKSALVNNVAGYAGTTSNPRRIGYAKEILIDGISNSVPKMGQMVTFGTQTTKYAIIQIRIIDQAAGTFGIVLDRPLVDPITDNMTVNFGPVGKYNLAIVPNAVTLVNRVPAAPMAGAGAIARSMADQVNKIALRVTISYDADMQAHKVVIDTYIGVGHLSTDWAAVMYG